jgi:uncharacterized membrane protein YgdD (TMEM256/DUF423 family)
MRRGGGGGLLWALAALAGAVAVAAGAFGAHGASGRAAEWLRTGSQYQLIHAVIALVALGSPRGHKAALAFVGGGAIFGGTLYAMALGAPRWLGAVTPIGGALLILGWVLLALRR